jgi:hypothetical protein
MRVVSLICTDEVSTGSWYDVDELVEDGKIYVFVGCGETYLLYSDEYEVIKE